MSGFSWNPDTKIWCAEPEVWERLIEKHPEAEEWRFKVVPNYDKMVILHGNDRATGEHSETASELRRKRSNSGTSDEFRDSIDDIDNLVSQNEVTLENTDAAGDDFIDFMTSPEIRSRATSDVPSGSVSKKSKKSKDDKDGDLIREGLELVANALVAGNAIYEKVNTRFDPISEEEIWKLLENIGIDEECISTAYLYFIDKPEKVRAVLGCPWEKRKQLVEKLVFGSSGH
ncbi:hypothetical protein CCACVL1_17605 [Corchorus capsularis]|uniref:Myb/SANT-like domain-containing protein n=1 Tax=Corchorus capsularis TaxID=210143 RepID=A0A1R3HQT6_COCAP|nr:hypothetical protein CCACVL1_17605 [Corchorus capsularis]